MCKKQLALLYALFIERTSNRIAFIERHLPQFADLGRLSEDDRRNQPEVYRIAFSKSCRPYVEALYLEAMTALTTVPFEQSVDTLNGLAFVQEVSAAAMWRYNCDVGRVLEAFAREFDRLDLESERRRLYARAQTG